MEKETCRICGKMAVWYYMPGYDGESKPYYCDDCVPRGCQCNHYSIRDEDYSPPGGIKPTPTDNPIKWIDEHTWTSVDKQGREYPCCEYDYDKDGFEKYVKIIDKIKIMTSISLVLILGGGLMNYILLPLYVKLGFFLPVVLEMTLKDTIIFCLMTCHLFWLLFTVISFVFMVVILILIYLFLLNR